MKVYAREMKKALKQRENLNNKASVWEFLGPTNVEGRITDIELKPGTSQTLFAGTASGGVFKSEDMGNSWEPVFDDEPTLSIGDIAISESNPEIMYVGTGEANAGGGSLAYDGLGVFKSVDGGNTWEFSGLEDAGSIGRIVVNPENPDVVYVAAMGRLFSSGGTTGVYKSVDGGQTWEQKLFVTHNNQLLEHASSQQYPSSSTPNPH